MPNKLTLEQVLDKSPPPFPLYVWQKEDIREATQHDRFALFLPVGSGKSVISTMIAIGWNDPHIIVLLPPILSVQWVKFLNSIPNNGKALNYRGTPKQRHNLPIEDYKWLVMSLDIFKKDFDLLNEYFLGKDVITIVDEAQCLKSCQSQSYKRVNQFSAGKKLLLATGTELNNPGDAYSYIKLKTPSLYRSAVHFENIHVAEVDFFGKTTKWQELEVLKTNLYLRSAKRTKEDVHKALPKATYTPIEYELEPAHKKLYDKLVNEMLLELPSGGKIDATTAVGLYTKSQQIIVNWSTFAGETSLRPAIFDVIDQVCDEIDLGKAGASKLILWTWFKRTTEAVRDYMNSKYPNSTVAAYSGADSIKSVARFLDDPTCTVLVGQPGSVGMGLNPQHLCWECLFIEAPTRSIPFKQAAGRIDRQGQKYNPTIRVATASGTIQCKMFRNLLSNDTEVMLIQSEKDLRSAIYGG